MELMLASGVCSDFGWMTAELFLKSLEEFIELTDGTVERPVLLLIVCKSPNCPDVIPHSLCNMSSPTL